MSDKDTIQIHGGFQVVATDDGPLYVCPKCQHPFPGARPYREAGKVVISRSDLNAAIADITNNADALHQCEQRPDGTVPDEIAEELAETRALITRLTAAQDDSIQEKRRDMADEIRAQTNHSETGL